MIYITVGRNSNGYHEEFEISGHAIEGKSEENKIICAGISAISQTFILGLKYIIFADFYIEKEHGRLKIKISKSDNNTIIKNDIELLFKTMLTGILDIQRSNPQYIIINFVEK